MDELVYDHSFCEEEDENASITTFSDNDSLIGKPIPFPLPAQQNDALCRDEYLRILLKPFESNAKASRIRITNKVYEILYDQESITLEGMMMLKMIKQKREESVYSASESLLRSLTDEEKQIAYVRFLKKFQISALQYLGVRMRKQVETILNIYPGDLTEVPNKLFHWSLQHFLHRHKVNQLYLEILTRESSSAELDCAKFCTDIMEIIRLTSVILNDVNTGGDLCKNSIQVLEDAYYEEYENWQNKLNSLREDEEYLAEQVNATVRRVRETARLSDLGDQIAQISAMMPVVLRYRINWLKACQDQHLMYLQNKEAMLNDEIEEINQKIIFDLSSFGSVDFIYQYQIDMYKAAIIDWQLKLDMDLEDAELQCNVTANQLSKAKEDLKFFKSQVAMFRRRVEEVNETVVIEASKSTRKSRRSARFSVMAKGSRRGTTYSGKSGRNK